MPPYYVTTTIPYVNARPHLGFALELVQADVLARHRRRCGDAVRLLSGTDDNSLKNVLAAREQGVSTRELVDRNSAAFEALREPLDLSTDDFIRTSRDPRHRPGVERLWHACAASGDLYRRHYEGLYCVGCEQFYSPADLPDGLCPEHRTRPERIAEENWFFRLSRYGGQLHDLIAGGRLRIEPAVRRNEVLAFIAGGLDDISVSRARGRAHDWGIPVPGHPDQVVYVWWDALGNYVSALDYGTEGAAYDRWWRRGGRRVHLLGKGVVRFHAVYWPAMLLSAGEPLPTDLFVHDYLTVAGQKISKSAPGAVAPESLVERYGTDPVRWWLLRESPRGSDVDFTVARLVDRTNAELANGLGNLVNRVVSMVHRYREGRPPRAPVGRAVAGAAGLADAVARVSTVVDDALDRADFRAATAAVWHIVADGNRCVEAVRPWALARTERAGDPAATADLDAALGALVAAGRVLAAQLAPFLPGTAAGLADQLTPVDGRLPAPRPVFPRIEE
jgi:methionyl-tRNA synthetase